MLDFSKLNVGLTNRCRLLCPECTRNSPEFKYIHSLYDINVEHFKDFIVGCNPREILFCGNWGDPIYTENFLGLLASLKSTIPFCSIFIHTNGSGKSTAWWEEFASILGHRDHVKFSVDGTPENYNKYRINSKWEDVENAIKTCVATKRKLNKRTRYTWKHLVFSYNENTIMESYEKSRELGIDFVLQESIVNTNHQITPSGGGNWLNPSRPFIEIKREFNERKSKSVL